MTSTEDWLRESLCDLGRSLFDRGLTAGSSGNLSVRVDDGWLVTPTDASLGRLDPGRLARIDRDGAAVAGDPPSKEVPLHLAVYRARPTAGAVVHLHSHWSVAATVLSDIDPINVLPPLTAYQVMKVGRVPLVPYHRPGDPNLATAIEALASAHAAVLLAHHGPVVAGCTLEDAVNAAEELEAAARLFVTLRGIPVRELTEPQVEELRRELGAVW